MAKKPANPKTVETLTHEDATRKIIPTAEYQSVLQKNEQSPVRLAFERRNRDLDPQLAWRGKDEQDWSDLVVYAPPLHIQDKVHPKVLIDDLRRLRSRKHHVTRHGFRNRFQSLQVRCRMRAFAEIQIELLTSSLRERHLATVTKGDAALTEKGVR